MSYPRRRTPNSGLGGGRTLGSTRDSAGGLDTFGAPLSSQQQTRIITPWYALLALKVKQKGCDGSVMVNVAVTGSNVPGVKAGIVTTTFV